MPNMGQIISKANKKKIQTHRTKNEVEARTCNCARNKTCEVGGKCLTSSVVYCASVTRTDTNETSTYTGLTQDSLKSRINKHHYTFRHAKERDRTTLSSHIWRLKEQNVNFELKWRILAKAKSYHPATKICHLCNAESYFILRKPETASLNSRTEIMNKCRHMNKFKLCRN